MINDSLRKRGWSEVTFLDISRSLKRGPFGGSLKKAYFVESGIKIYEQQHAINKDYTLGNYYIDEVKYEEMKSFTVLPGDYIVSCSGTIGMLYRLPKEAPKGVINQALLKIELDERILTHQYFSYLFQSEYFQRMILLDSRGTGMKNLAGMKEMKRVPIYVPPVVEQRVIVSKIEELISELDNGIENLIKAKDKLEIYRQAVLKKAFEGEMTMEWRKDNPYDMNLFIEELKQEKMNAIKDKLISKSEYFPEFDKGKLTYNTPSNWIVLPWKTITSNSKYSMKRGPFGSALKKEYFVENGIVVYEQTHAINDNPYRHRYFITEDKFEEMKAFMVKGGDMIISCSGTLGKICLLPDDADVGVINQALLKIDLDERIILKKFFLLLFRSETFQRLIFEKSLGTAMLNMVGMTELKEIPIPIPSIEEQRVIISEIEFRLSVCDNILSNIDDGLGKSEALRQSILKKAFEGKLLTNEVLEQCRKESDWEPAEKLLERIKKMK